MSGFFELAEELWAEWLDGRPRVPPALASRFDLGACPEPYLDFAAGSAPLVVVTTNPGAAMPHQSRQAILAGRSPARLGMSYRTVAGLMAEFYLQHLRGPAARRIAAQEEISRGISSSGVIQVECIPWHSSDLPGKTQLLSFFQSDPAFATYIARLKQFVAEHATVAISAISSRACLGQGLALSPWITWQASLLGLAPESATFVPLVRRGERVTCAALVSHSGRAPKALVLMMGTNNFPGSQGRATLVEALSRPG